MPLDPATFRAELAAVQRELRVLLSRVQRLQDSLGSGPVAYDAEVIRVERRKV